MSSFIKYGIIGAGTMGQEHIKNVNLLDNAKVTSICDPNEGSLNQSSSLITNDFNSYRDLDELINNDDADAYIIATPNFTHIEVLEKILKTNKHLLIEKPLCTTIDDCKKFQLISKDYSKVIWVGMEYRYMPPVKKLIERVHNKTLGKLKMVSIREHRFPFLKKVDNWNRFDSNTGGTMVEKCCHFFDLMRFITQSEVKQVFASGSQDVNHLDEKYNGKVPDIIDNGFVIIDFQSGVRGLLDLCMFAENSEYQEEVVAVGDKGKIEAFVPSHDSGKNISEVKMGMRNSSTIITDDIEVDKKILMAGHHHGSTYFEHLAFYDAIKNNTLPDVSLEDGLMSVAIGQAAELSIKENRVIKMSEFNL